MRGKAECDQKKVFTKLTFCFFAPWRLGGESLSLSAANSTHLCSCLCSLWFTSSFGLQLRIWHMLDIRSSIVYIFASNFTPAHQEISAAEVFRLLFHY